MPCAWLTCLLLLLPLFGHAALTPAELAVVVNDDDPLSVEVGEYYQKVRGIPSANMIHVHLPPDRPAISAEEFGPIRARILAATPSVVQAYALAWAAPYRVDCMSMTSAVTFGFDPAWCSHGEGCSPTRPSPLYDYNTTQPFTDLGVRPSMMLAATRFTDARLLIDRGLQSDGSRPAGSAYLLLTHDRARSARQAAFARALQLRIPGVATHLLRQDALLGRQDVLFYFTGLARVDGLSSLTFLPGAVGDHLTSFGGMLTDSSQMSALRWLEAGATGSYGTVTEPCSFPQKFPNPAILMRRYTRGETLIEAYWKSVSSPGEGVFIGEPLANPWRKP